MAIGAALDGPPSLHRLVWIQGAHLAYGLCLTLAQTQFDVFLTMDQGIPHQQNIPKFEIAVLLLRAASNDIDDLKPLVPAILAATPTPKSER